MDTWKQLDLWAQSLLWVIMGEEGRLGVPVTADTQHPEPGRPRQHICPKSWLNQSR